MNLFVCVDENLNILSLNHFKPYKKTMQQIRDLLENKAIVFDNEFLNYVSCVPECTKIIFDENSGPILPEFMRPLSKSKEKLIGEKQELFDYLRRLEDKNIFVIGHKIFKIFLPSVTDIYLLTIMDCVPSSARLIDIRKNAKWQNVNHSDPIFENERVLYFSHYVRKPKMKKLQERSIEY